MVLMLSSLSKSMKTRNIVNVVCHSLGREGTGGYKGHIGGTREEVVRGGGKRGIAGNTDGRLATLKWEEKEGA